MDLVYHLKYPDEKWKMKNADMCRIPDRHWILQTHGPQFSGSKEEWGVTKHTHARERYLEKKHKMLNHCSADTSWTWP